MAQLSRGILGAVAIATGVSLTFGAAQFASGRDLSGVTQNLVSKSAQAQETDPVSTSASINRASKSDRVANAARATEPSQTFSLRLSGHPDTSVIVRIPRAREARNLRPLLMQSQDRTVACEPTVSVLTEISKQLQPGRCVT